MEGSKIEILSTRELSPEGQQLTALHDFNVTTTPFIEIIRDVPQETAMEIQSLAKQDITVIFTSVNAVNAVLAHLAVVPAWTIFCIGGATKTTLLQFFDSSALRGSAKNAILLSEEILACSDLNTLVFFCGNLRMNYLPDRLSAAGVGLREIVVYKTLLKPVVITKNFEGILFFSPSAVDSFFSVNSIPEKTILFSIGESTTAALNGYSHNKIFTSSWPSESELLKMVSDYYQST